MQVLRCRFRFPNHMQCARCAGHAGVHNPKPDPGTGTVSDRRVFMLDPEPCAPENPPKGKPGPAGLRRWRRWFA